jgi:hypothetical protein
MYVRVPDSLSGGGGGGGGGSGNGNASVNVGVARRGARETAIVESVDLMPTLADLAGLQLPPQVTAAAFVGDAERATVEPRPPSLCRRRRRRTQCALAVVRVASPALPFFSRIFCFRLGCVLCCFFFSPPCRNRTTQAIAGETLRPFLFVPAAGESAANNNRSDSAAAAAAAPAVAAAAAAAAPRQLATTAAGAPAARNKTYALSQWPRRPSCTTSRGCTDGHGDPSVPDPDVAIMGYALRVDQWRCVRTVRGRAFPERGAGRHGCPACE